MFIFLFSFIIFTFTNTFFQNIKISILTLIFCIIFLTIFLILKYKKILFSNIKYILILILAFIISLWAIIIKQYNYSPEFVKNFLEFNIITSRSSVDKLTMTGSSFSYFIWTWKIVDTYSFGKYIFQNNDWENYILNSEKKYQIWDELRLVGYKKETELSVQKNNLSWLWNRSFDYDRRLIMKGYRGNIYEQNSVLTLCHHEEWYDEGYNYVFQNTENNKKRDFSASLKMTETCWEWKLQLQNQLWFIQIIKRSLQSQISSIYWDGRNAWLILWMLIWDKSQIPKLDYQNFIDSWLVHLIAVSWWNIIMLTIFLWFALFFLPFYVRNFVILLSIVLYSLVCWMDSSVLRAVLFGWLGMMALFVGRETNFWRSVYIAFVVMLLINPYFLLYDLWFLLSFGAIIWIRILTKNKDEKEKKEIPAADFVNNAGMTKGSDSSDKLEWQTWFIKALKKIYNNYIKPSIWANIWIFPVIIFFMWKINLVWFITNLFVLPIVPFVMIYWFLSIFLYWLLPRSWFIYIQELLINYIYKISEIWSNYWIYLLVDDYKIKYLILILFVIWLIIYMIRKKIIHIENPNNNKSIIPIIK